jgi:hypothetical protein
MNIVAMPTRCRWSRGRTWTIVGPLWAVSRRTGLPDLILAALAIGRVPVSL